MQVIKKIFSVIAYLWFIISIVIVISILAFSESISVYLAKSLIINEDYVYADAIVLLGGEEGSKRLEKAVELYNEGYGDIIINSGNGSDDYALKKFSNYGLDETDFINEANSTTTYENALFTKDIVLEQEYESVIIVSTPQQSRRARWIFEKVYKELDVEIYSAIIDDSEFVPEEIGDSKFTKEYFVLQFVKLVHYYWEYWRY